MQADMKKRKFTKDDKLQIIKKASEQGVKVICFIIFIALISCNENQKKGSKEKAGDLNQPGFMWDLAHGKQYTYSYNQHMVNQISSENTEMNNKVSGIMVIKSREDTTGTIEVKDLTATMLIENEQGRQDSFMKPMSGFNASGLKPNGMVGQINNVFRGILPMPRFDLKKGKSDMVLFEFPINKMEYQAKIIGDYVLTWTKDTTINEHQCAVIEANLIDPKMDLINGDIEDVDFEIYVGGEYYFDRTKHCFIGGTYLFNVKIFKPDSSMDEEQPFSLMDSKIQFNLQYIQE